MSDLSDLTHNKKGDEKMDIAFKPGMVLLASIIGSDGNPRLFSKNARIIKRELMNPDNPVVIEAIREFGVDSVNSLSDKHSCSRSFIRRLKRIMARTYTADPSKQNLARFLRPRDLLPENIRDVPYDSIEIPISLSLPSLEFARRMGGDAAS